MKILLTYLLLGLTFWSQSQLVLPGYKDGAWWIIRENGNIELPKTITSLGNFDQNGNAIFVANAETGILDRNGNVLYTGNGQFITSIGHGLFVIADGSNDKLIDLVSNETLLDSLSEYEIFNDTYAHFTANQDTQLMFLPQRLKWKVSPSFSLINSYFKTVYVRQDSLTKAIYTPKGEQVLIGGNSIFSSRFLTYTLGSNRYAVTKTRTFSVSSDAGNIEVNGNFLCYSNGGQATLLDLENDQVIAKVPYDEIFPFPEGGFRVRKNGRRGLLNAQLVEVIPPKYTAISKVNENYQVMDKGLWGLMDKNFALKIPCEFSTIRSDSNFYYTQNQWNIYGLYAKSFDQILATQYSKIIVRDRLVKAYSSDKIRIIHLDLDDKIISDIILDNAVTAKQTKVSGNFIFDRRILPLGWFYERKAKLDTAGVIEKYSYVWGIKDASDSIIQKPKYLNPEFVHNAPFSMVYGGDKQFTFDRIKYNVGRTYELVDYTKGRRADFKTYLNFRSEDGINRSFYRCATTEGIGLFGQKGEFEKLTYVSSTNHRLIPYAKEGALKIVEDKTEDCLMYGQCQPVNSIENVLDRFGSYNSLFSRYVHLEEAKWNYLDTNGENRFSEDFTFANDFYRGTAIIKRKSGWGVINSDSLIIPCRYSSIARIDEFEDTLFLVKRNASKELFLDSNLQELDPSYKRVKMQRENLVVMTSDVENAVYYKGRLLEKDTKTLRLINESYWMIRSKRVYHVFDTNGVEIIATAHKPLDVLPGEFLWVDGKGKMGIISSTGDTVVPFARQKMNKYQHFYLIYSNAKVELFDLNFNKLREQKSNEKIIPNQFTTEYAVLKNDKLKIYNEHQKVTQKWDVPFGKKVIEFRHAYVFGTDFFLQDTFLIEMDRNNRTYMHPDGMLALEYDTGKTHYFWQSIEKPFFVTNSISDRYLGEKAIVYVDGNKENIVREGKEISYFKNQSWNSTRSYSDGLYIKKAQKKHEYFNTDLDVVLTKYLDFASSFEDGIAAVSVDGSWTLMDKKGQYKSYPSYDKIERVSANIYKTKEAPKFGLMDSQGNEIIPCKYERINILENGIIQVVLSGQMGYFNLQGEELFPI